jgi:hypothetical protein
MEEMEIGASSLVYGKGHSGARHSWISYITSTLPPLCCLRCYPEMAAFVFYVRERDEQTDESTGCERRAHRTHRVGGRNLGSIGMDLEATDTHSEWKKVLVKS